MSTEHAYFPASVSCTIWWGASQLKDMYGKRLLSSNRGHHGWGRPSVTMVPDETLLKNGSDPERLHEW